MNTANEIIKAQNLCRSYGTVEALRGISFSVPEGEIFGIIGPDGAGKTTLFRILTTLILPDSGAATIDHLDVIRNFRKIRQQVGYMPGRFSLYPDLTVEENLRFFATLFHTTIRDNYDLVRDIYSQIEPFKDRRAGKLSGGMKQKLALSCALIHKPRVLFLDEPTTGVDPVSRKEFWGMLQRLKAQGLTILVSTPYMAEAELCDRIALIRQGRFMTIASPQEIIHNFGEILWAVKSQDMFRLLKDLRRHPALKSSFAFGEVHHITVQSGQLTIGELNSYLLQQGHTGIEITPIQASIEDCYMKLAEE